MKKIMTLAAMFAAVAVSFSACTKDNGNQGTGNGNGNENTEPEYEAPITVDGDFADWQTLGDKAEIAVCPEDALKLGLKEFRAYADEVMLYVYVKFDLDVVTNRDVPEPEPGVESGNPLALFFSTSTEKGGYANTWSDSCVEYHCASFIFNGTEQYENWDDALYMWTGELHGAGWSWDSALESLASTGAGTGDQYEIAIMMDVLTSVMELDGQILLGAMIQQGWNNAGALPCASPDPDNNPNGMAPMMVVPIN